MSIEKFNFVCFISLICLSVFSRCLGNKAVTYNYKKIYYLQKNGGYRSDMQTYYSALLVLYFSLKIKMDLKKELKYQP